MVQQILLLLLLILNRSFCDDYYELLGLKRTANEKEIRQAFKKIAVNLHPDKNPDDPEAHPKFLKYTTAYEVLKDPELRKKYDLYGEEGLNNDQFGRQNYHSWSYYQDNFGIYDDDPQVVTLNTNDYDDNVVNSEKIWMINFYSPMCSHCHHLAPDWRRIAKDFEGIVRVGAVNCEDDWRLCRRLNIQAYPTLLYYPKNSHHGTRYTSKKTYEKISEFIMEHLDVSIEKITSTKWKKLIKLLDENNNDHYNNDKPLLVFTCGKERNCFENEEQLKITAMFDNIIDTGIFECSKNSCNKLLETTGAVFINNIKNNDKKHFILFNDLNNIDEFVHDILDELPEPQDISNDYFNDIKKNLEKNDNENGWLVCFYIGHATDLDLQLKKLPSIITDVNLGKVNCGKYSSLCSNLNINRYPMWGVIKPGGAFELSHGKSTINDVAKFAENSIKAQNVAALSADKIISILKRQNGKEVWFLDWYAPWCPPCMQFLPELRKASMQFKKSVVQFGTIDCTVHADICRRYNIRSYPTAMLINGTTTTQFTNQKTAAGIIEFLNEVVNPTVIKLNKDNYYKTVGRKDDTTLWVIDYFAPWCGPCQQLAPEWTIVAKNLHLLDNVKVASVDCDANGDLCRELGVRSYPTIRLYPFGSVGLNQVALFNGQRDSTALMQWITNFFPTKIKNFDEEKLRKNIFNKKSKSKNKKDYWLIDYYAPWCGHCQKLEPQFAIAAQLLKNNSIGFGKFNCDTFGSECNQLGIQAYPTLMLYTPENKRSGIEITSQNAQDIKNNILNLINKNSKLHDEL
ncbi:dnaJ homolog subfamily C member 10 [Microplitis demolitor]|uniref:dnaJ homolog subfamily C member 10 n=1 Tax=Microplitis demolitor TaxID=69319 RepID=UPI00043FFFC3|nr:dnaJ homolog subfamily C member 10 [Microplitis demolitor]